MQNLFKGVSNSHSISNSNDQNETVPILSSYVSKGASFTSISTLMAVRSYSQTEGQWCEFLIHICPIDLEDWSERTYFGKLVHVIKVKLKIMRLLSIYVFIDNLLVSDLFLIDDNNSSR